MYPASGILQPENFPVSTTMGGLLFKKALSAGTYGFEPEKKFKRDNSRVNSEHNAVISHYTNSNKIASFHKKSPQVLL
jgi:hypothetical protein